MQTQLPQLDNQCGGNASYKSRVSQRLVPCLVKFANAVGDDSLWKELNTEILYRLRDEDKPQVRGGKG